MDYSHSIEAFRESMSEGDCPQSAFQRLKDEADRDRKMRDELRSLEITRAEHRYRELICVATEQYLAETGDSVYGAARQYEQAIKGIRRTS